MASGLFDPVTTSGATMAQRLLVAFALLAALGAGCGRGRATPTRAVATPPAAGGVETATTTTATTRPTSLPATEPAGRANTDVGLVAFHDAKGGIRLEYPAGWSRQADADYVLKVTSGEQSLSVELPDLPPHLPGLIPLPLVENGFIDDLRKAHPDLKVDEAATVAVPGAHARRVRTSWRAGDERAVQVALLMVHGDHVYLLRADSDADHAPAARAAFDAAVASLEWDNPGKK